MIENVMFFDDWDITYFPMFHYVEKTNDQKYRYPALKASLCSISDMGVARDGDDDDKF